MTKLEVLVVGALLLSGCKKGSDASPESSLAAKAHAAYDAQVKAMIGRAKEIGSKLPPPASAPVEGSKFRVFSTRAPRVAPNTILAHVEELADPSKRTAMKYAIPIVGQLESCEYGTRPAATNDYALKTCAEFEYLAVVRYNKVVDPVLKAESFTPGTVDGDVVLVALKDGKVVGDNAFHAENTHSIESKASSTEAAKAGFSRLLDQDLANNVLSAVKATVSLPDPPY
jgi:hypothetical protein